MMNWEGAAEGDNQTTKSRLRRGWWRGERERRAERNNFRYYRGHIQKTQTHVQRQARRTKRVVEEFFF
jgi:hypothetical protein